MGVENEMNATTMGTMFGPATSRFRHQRNDVMEVTNHHSALAVFPSDWPYHTQPLKLLQTISGISQLTHTSNNSRAKTQEHKSDVFHASLESFRRALTEQSSHDSNITMAVTSYQEVRQFPSPCPSIPIVQHSIIKTPPSPKFTQTTNHSNQPTARLRPPPPNPPRPRKHLQSPLRRTELLPSSRRRRIKSKSLCAGGGAFFTFIFFLSSSSSCRGGALHRDMKIEHPLTGLFKHSHAIAS